MGPLLIYDKSTLQGLNPDEAMWLDNFYLTNITPLFFVETLADLEKETKNGRTAEDIVGSIAYKTPDKGWANTHHKDLLANELFGKWVIDMTGKIATSQGQPVKLEGETGIIFQESREALAVRRWQEKKFLEIEREVAKEWRDELSSSKTEEKVKAFEKLFAIFGTPKSIDELKALVEKIINNPLQRANLKFGLSVMGMTPEGLEFVLSRWESTGRKPIREFAPYFSHVFSVDLFFYLGTAANLLSGFPHASTHNVDIAYLYYLPFCQLFVSDDKLHIGIAKYFLREDQMFIDGKDLKADLARLDAHYFSLSDEVKKRGVYSFAALPPDDDSFLVTQLWDKYMDKEWRKSHTRKFDGTDQIDPEHDKKLLEQIKKFAQQSTPATPSQLDNLNNVNQVLVKRTVLGKKGKWHLFPPEVENSKPLLD